MASKAYSQVDSMKVLRDSIFNLKANYIGKPLTKLLTDLKVNVEFSPPDNSSTRTKGIAYYQNIILFLPWTPNFPSRGFKIQLASRVQVDLSQFRINHASGVWDTQMITTLGSQTIVSLQKFVN